MYIPSLSPYIFSIGPLHIHYYSVFMIISILIGFYLISRQRERIGVSEVVLENATLWAVVGGIVGARLVFVAANDAGWFIHDPMQILRIWQGGLAWHGAVGGGLLAAWLYLRNKGVNFSLFMDGVVPGVAVGIILVRVGNIFNHEVLGHTAAILGGARWPVQPIGSAIGIFLLLHFYWYLRKNPPAGAQFWSFLFYYTLLRGLIEETLRADPTLFIHWSDPTLGIAVTTVLQVWTPFILVASWLIWRFAVKGGFERRHESGEITERT